MQRLQTRGVGWCVAPLVVVLFVLILAAPAFALDPPWNTQTITPGLGPSYGTPWPVAPSNEAVFGQIATASTNLSDVPYASIGPLLAQFDMQDQWNRMTYSVTGLSQGGRNMYAVVINDLETADQQRDYANWQTFRAEELTDPAKAQSDLAAWGGKVKMAIYIEGNINGTEYESTDADLQAIQDLVTTPRGANPTIDKLLDHAIIVFVPCSNPDGRVLGQRGNQWGLDTNRDYLNQSQPEQQIDAPIQQKYVATGALHQHGYVTPTLIDGLTMPHNPGLEWDIFGSWNQLRTEANRTDFAAAGTASGNYALSDIQVPNHEWDANGNMAGYWIADAPAGATESGTTVTIQTTANPTSISAGSSVVISDVTEAGYNGTVTVVSARPTATVAAIGVPGASEAGNVVTITTTAANQAVVGGFVTIAGVGTGYNGTWRVTGTPAANKFTFNATTTGLANAGGGTVTFCQFTYTSGSSGLAASGAGMAYFTNPHGANAQSWDDWGPFYGQTYMALLGGESSTVEMASTAIGSPLGGRWTSKMAQYLAFYSSANFWIDNRQAMMQDQVEIFDRGVSDADFNPNLIGDNSVLSSRGFTDFWHNWTLPYPKAYIIPWGNGQRSEQEANHLAQWLLDNGVLVGRATSDFVWNGTTYQAGSYVVWMNQALRGIALNALYVGTDIESKITVLYASPGAWSLAYEWGANTVQVPRYDSSFAPSVIAAMSTNPLEGGVRDGVNAPSDWYSVALKSWREYPTIQSLLKSGVKAHMAEAPFASTTGGTMPAGTMIFPASAKNQLDAAGQAAGIWFERNVGVEMPAVGAVSEAPNVAILVSTTPAYTNNRGAYHDELSGSLSEIFGPDASYVATTTGADSLQNAATDPLAGYDVIVDAGASWPSTVSVAPIGATIASASTPGASEVGNTVTIRVSSWPIGSGLHAGSTVTIAGVSVAGYNGTFTVNTVSGTTFTYTNPTSGLASSGGGTAASPDVTPGARESGTQVTITTASAHSLVSGNTVVVAGLAVGGYNGRWTVTGVPNATQFTFTASASGLADSGSGTCFTTATNTTACARLSAFFARGGGYIAQSSSANNFSLLTPILTPSAPGSVAQQITGTSNGNAYGGIATWMNKTGASSAISGTYPSSDYFFMPSSITYFSAIPSGAVVDGQWPDHFSNIGTENGFLAGMWRDRTTAIDQGPVLIHGATTTGSRYVALDTNPFSRCYPEREWQLVVQAALWTNLTDEVTIDAGPTTQTAQYSDAIQPLTIGAHDANASGSSLVATPVGLPSGVTLTPASNNGSTTPGAATWSVSGKLTAPAGDYPVTVTVTDGARTLGSVSFTITVKQEDSFLLYNGSVAIPAGTTPTLGSQFWDSAAVGYPGLNPEPGGTIGDITKAWVHFALMDASGPSIGIANAQVADTATLGDGIGSASITSPFKSSGDAVWLVTSSIVKDGTGATPNLYYTAPADETGMIIFYVDTGQFATGGGTIPTGDKKSNFGFVARYNKGGAPKGQVVYLFRGTYNGADATFKVKSTSVTGLAFSGTDYPITSTLAGKCNITIVDGKDRTLFNDGNWRYTASATDVDKGSGSDAFAITIWDKNNQLYKSVPTTPLSGGNITIHNPKSK